MTTPTTYNINNSLKGVNSFGTPFCSTIYTTTLVAATPATITVPGLSAMGNINSSVKAQYVAVFSYTADAAVYISLNANPAVPAGDSFELSASVLNPKAKIVKEGDVIHVVSAGTPDVCVELFYIQEG